MCYLTSFLAGRPRNQEELATVRHGPLPSNHCSGTAIIPAEVLLEDPGTVALEYTSFIDMSLCLILFMPCSLPACSACTFIPFQILTPTGTSLPLHTYWKII